MCTILTPQDDPPSGFVLLVVTVIDLRHICHGTLHVYFFRVLYSVIPAQDLPRRSRALFGGRGRVRGPVGVEIRSAEGENPRQSCQRYCGVRSRTILPCPPAVM